jgi:hypothetical protein
MDRSFRVCRYTGGSSAHVLDHGSSEGRVLTGSQRAREAAVSSTGRSAMSTGCQPSGLRSLSAAGCPRGVCGGNGLGGRAHPFATLSLSTFSLDAAVRADPPSRQYSPCRAKQARREGERALHTDPCLSDPRGGGETRHPAVHSPLRSPSQPPTAPWWSTHLLRTSSTTPRALCHPYLTSVGPTSPPVLTSLRRPPEGVRRCGAGTGRARSHSHAFLRTTARLCGAVTEWWEEKRERARPNQTAAGGTAVLRGGSGWRAWRVM